jgi:hypothetical protein
MVHQARTVNTSKGNWQPDGFGHWQGHRGITHFSDAEDDGRGGGEMKYQQDARSILPMTSRQKSNGSGRLLVIIRRCCPMLASCAFGMSYISARIQANLPSCIDKKSFIQWLRFPNQGFWKVLWWEVATVSRQISIADCHPQVDWTNGRCRKMLHAQSALISRC